MSIGDADAAISVNCKNTNGTYEAIARLELNYKYSEILNMIIKCLEQRNDVYS